LIDNALEYGPTHALGGQAATVQNANLYDRFYPFCVRFGGCRNRRPAGNERVEPHAQTGNGFIREAVFNFSGVEQRSVLPPRKIEAAEVRTVESDARDKQRLAILTWRLDPGPTARGAIGRIDPLRDDAFDVELMRVRPDSRPSASKCST
jgi:hypothetical protein